MDRLNHAGSGLLAALAAAALAAVLVPLAASGVSHGLAISGAAPSSPDTVTLVDETAVTRATDGVIAQAGEERPERAVATFAGGCFWCMEKPFDVLPGVDSTVVGFTGGRVADPSYDQVAAGGTGHREAVQVTYDPDRISYTRLLQVFWHNIDPADGGGQFCDRGGQYTTAIFVHNPEQRELARASRRRLERSELLDASVATPVLDAEPFYRAEEYHQDYYRKNTARYELYRKRCGRDERLREIWGEQAGH